MGRTNLAGPTTHPACHPVTENVFPQLAAAEGWGFECVDGVESCRVAVFVWGRVWK